MFLLLARFHVRPMNLDIFNEKGVIRVKEEKFRLPVDVRGSKTSALKLSNVYSRTNTIASRDRIKPIRIGDNFVVN